MISFEKALQIVKESAVLIGTENIPLLEASGRVLAEDALSDIDMPPFDKSAMDGFACRIEDLDRSQLRIIEDIPAGVFPEREVRAGECSRIMTGAAVPSGADCVVMVEHTEETNGLVTVKKRSHGRNVCYRAEDISAGDIVLRRGTKINSAGVAVLASIGCDPVNVFRKPVVCIIATGNELVEPSEKPEGAMIRNINGYQLCSQVSEAGFEPLYLGIAEDSPEAISRALDMESERVDVFLLSGGVSMGDYDFVPGVLREKGFKLLFEKVAVKPGKPTVFGRRGDTYVFGLPGNPVSTYMLFELLVKPFCFRLMGSDYAPAQFTARVLNAVSRKKTGRTAHLPVRFTDRGEVELVEYHGSAHINAISAADGFIVLPAGVSRIEAGEEVTVTLFR